MKVPINAHCPFCGYPCCGGSAEHVDHGGELTFHAGKASVAAKPPVTFSLSYAGKTSTYPVPPTAAEPAVDPDDPIANGLAAVRYENVFGRRPGVGPETG